MTSEQIAEDERQHKKLLEKSRNVHTSARMWFNWNPQNWPVPPGKAESIDLADLRARVNEDIECQSLPPRSYSDRLSAGFAMTNKDQIYHENKPYSKKRRP